MKNFIRNINLAELLKKKSVLLLGPRSTGKSYYIRNQLDNIHTINLLKSSEYILLNENPSALEDIVNHHKQKIICIDEVQKIPQLLDEVHRLIEEKNRRFLLTGSSARKLKANGVNLLAGRAWMARFYPLNYYEITNGVTDSKIFNLNRALLYGTLPQVWLSQDPIEELDSYVQTYIELEIKAEGIIRKIPNFMRFLKTAAIASGELLNYANISSDASVPATTIKEHYQILEDTMIGYNLESWTESKKRKAIGTGKFYFFDIGVLNQITQSFPESEDSPLWGNRFENYIINEVKCANSYQRRKLNINYWRSTSQFEVDILFGKTAIDIKSTKKISEKHLAGLKALREEKIHKDFIIISRDPIDRIHDNIHILNYKSFLKQLWSGSFG